MAQKNQTRQTAENIQIKSKQEVRFDLLKSSQFRNIHVDGAIGGLSPRGYVQFAVYCERVAIPTQISLKVNSDGSTSEIREKRISRDSMIRELEVNLVFDIQAAAALYQWLGEKIQDHKKIIGVQERK